MATTHGVIGQSLAQWELPLQPQPPPPYKAPPPDMFKLVHLNLQEPLAMFKLIGKQVVGLKLKGLFVL